jgi:hypothetical protein
VLLLDSTKHLIRRNEERRRRRRRRTRQKVQPVILPTQIRSFVVRSQPRQIVHQILSQKHETQNRIGGVT